MSADHSRVERVKYRGRETSTLILTADNTSIRRSPDGGLVIELFRYDGDGQPVESYAFHMCSVDRARLREQA